MRWLLAATILCLLVLLPAPLRADVVADVRGLCAERHPRDYALQDACYRRAYGAAREIGAALKGAEKGSVLRSLIGECLVRHKRDGVGVVDYPLANACRRSQVEAYRRVHGRDPPAR